MYFTHGKESPGKKIIPEASLLGIRIDRKAFSKGQKINFETKPDLMKLRL